MMLKRLLMAALCLAALDVHAAATDKLKTFIAATHSVEQTRRQQAGAGKSGSKLHALQSFAPRTQLRAL